MSIRPDVNDVVAFIGFGALIYGVSQWSAPAAWVVAGALLLMSSVAPKLRRWKGPRPS